MRSNPSNFLLGTERPISISNPITEANADISAAPNTPITPETLPVFSTRNGSQRTSVSELELGDIAEPQSGFYSSGKRGFAVRRRSSFGLVRGIDLELPQFKAGIWVDNNTNNSNQPIASSLTSSPAISPFPSPLQANISNPNYPRQLSLQLQQPASQINSTPSNFSNQQLQRNSLVSPKSPNSSAATMPQSQMTSLMQMQQQQRLIIQQQNFDKFGQHQSQQKSPRNSISPHMPHASIPSFNHMGGPVTIQNSFISRSRNNSNQPIITLPSQPFHTSPVIPVHATPATIMSVPSMSFSIPSSISAIAMNQKMQVSGSPSTGLPPQFWSPKPRPGQQHTAALSGIDFSFPKAVSSSTTAKDAGADAPQIILAAAFKKQRKQMSNPTIVSSDVVKSLVGDSPATTTRKRGFTAETTRNSKKSHPAESKNSPPQINTKKSTSTNRKKQQPAPQPSFNFSTLPAQVRLNILSHLPAPTLARFRALDPIANASALWSRHLIQLAPKLHATLASGITRLHNLPPLLCSHSPSTRAEETIAFWEAAIARQQQRAKPSGGKERPHRATAVLSAEFIAYAVVEVGKRVLNGLRCYACKCRPRVRESVWCVECGCYACGPRNYAKRCVYRG
ncbi:hypothetical protein HK100_001857 [Physocladia obscura]|uniref:F-box domain-containing protein n=1 Tax=Physocladia obscura TaxID=109957 RepID=A0AAD5SXX2_9FUNG|nr:hypothetical protein HK100_001857 [Physocladia obscura]